MIIRNSAKCLNCGHEIISKHRHDFKVCHCYAQSSMKRNQWLQEQIGLYGAEENIPTSVYAQAPEVTGIGVDGGKDYLKRMGSPEDFLETSILADEEND